MNKKWNNILLALILAASWFVAPAAPAQAADGDLSLQGCIGNNILGCTDVGPVNAAEGATTLAVSPDGATIYVGEKVNTLGAVGVFHRNPSTGELSLTGCIGSLPGCNSGVPLNAIADPESIVSLLDDVYVLSVSPAALLHFRRERGLGRLTYEGCLGAGVSSCTNAGGTAMAYIVRLAASPDGRNLYATSSGFNGSVLVFNRDPRSGSIAYSGCVGDPLAGCTAGGGAGSLMDILDIAVAPDGDHVYTVAQNPGAVAVFLRDRQSGMLSYLNCVGQAGASCVSIEPARPLYKGRALAFSPDGLSLYVATANGSGGVAHLRRDPTTGGLAYAGCIGEAITGCTATGTGVSLAVPNDITVTPDGASVYTISQTPGAIAHFNRNLTSGGLAYAGCIGSAGTSCTQVGNNALISGSGVVSSPDSRFVLTSAGRPVDMSISTSGAVAVFGRNSLAPAASIITNVSPNGKDGNGNAIYTGRIQDVAMDPATSNTTHRYLATADQGGLWESVNGGVDWAPFSNLSSFGVFRLTSVVFDPVHPGRVLVTTGDSSQDRDSSYKGGIFVSTDSGHTFVPAESMYPTGCDWRGVRRVAMNPANSQEVFAAGGCQVGISSTDGNSFSWLNPSGMGENYYSGAYTPDGTLLVCGNSNIYRRTVYGSNNTSWTNISLAGAGLGAAQNCDIAIDPTDASHFFLAAVFSGPVRDCPGNCSAVLEGIISGNTATFYNLNGSIKSFNRDVVVQIRPGATQTTFGLYNVDGVGGLFLNCSSANTPNHCQGGAVPEGGFWGANWVALAWTGTNVAIHGDPIRFIFDPVGANHCILLVAGDGGIEVPSPTNCDGASPTGWLIRSFGLRIQQSYNLSITRLQNGKDDLYIGLQDIGFQYRDPVTGWFSHDVTDGYHVAVDPDQGSHPIRMIYRSNTYISTAGQYFDSPAGLPGPLPNSNVLMSEIWIGNQSYLALGGIDTDHDYTETFFTTTDQGASWTQLGSSTTWPDYAPLTSRTIMQAVDSPAGALLFIRQNSHLYRVNGSGPSATLVRIDSGLHYAGAFAVSPLNAQRMIAFDCQTTYPCTNGQVMLSTNGGVSWHASLSGTTITYRDGYGNHYGPPRGGNQDDVGPTAFAFDPTDDRLIVMATHRAGAFASADGGASWQILPPQVTDTSSIVFGHERGHFYIDSYGNGVWELKPHLTSITLAAPSSQLPGQPVSVSVRAQDMDGWPVQAAEIIIEQLSPQGTVLATQSGKPNSNGEISLQVQPQNNSGYLHLRARIGPSGSFSSAETVTNVWIGSVVYLPITIK